MTRIGIVTLLAAFVAVGLPAQTSTGIPPDEVAHGAEKVAHKVAHPEEPHHEAERTYFGIPGWILKLINMILFVGLLVYLLAGPVKNALRERAQRIEQQLAEARERREKADRMAEEIGARLGKLEDEVAMILQRADEEGERQKQEIIAAANEEAEKILRSARTEVDARIKQARKELTDYAGELAAERAHKILENSLTANDQRKIFDESLDSIVEKRS